MTKPEIMSDERLAHVKELCDNTTVPLWHPLPSTKDPKYSDVSDAAWADAQRKENNYLRLLEIVENVPHLLRCIEAQRLEIEAEHGRVRRLAEALEDVRVHGSERSWSHVDYAGHADDVLTEVYASYAEKETQP